MILMIDAAKLAARIESEIRDAEAFQENVESHLNAMRKAEDSEYLVSLANGIAYNRQMMALPIQRATVLLELTKLYDRDEDILTISLLKERLEKLREQIRASERATDMPDTN